MRGAVRNLGAQPGIRWWCKNVWRNATHPTTLVATNCIREACTMKTEERLMLYQIAIQDIRDFKANQWRISHCGVE